MLPCAVRPRATLPWRARHPTLLLWTAGLVLALSACGGGGGGGTGASPAPVAAPQAAPLAASAPSTPSRADAQRLATQASFGATEALVGDILAQGPAGWVAGQQAVSGSRYVSGGSADIHRWNSWTPYCDRTGRVEPDEHRCWRENYSSQPLVRDFYRNALQGRDQLRQRVAWALQQILVVSNVDVEGTYGARRYHNALLDGAFGNWRELMRGVVLSPLMGDYLGHVNNHHQAPNENFARELLQLFSIGPCRLEADGSMAGGRCEPNYDNGMVREYAHALTGWTYPAGGAAPAGCYPAGAHCRFHDGDMLPLPSFHDRTRRRLLSGVELPAERQPQQALEAVLDSLMQHPSLPPHVGRQLIQHLVSSNPSPAYVRRVASAFADGRYSHGQLQFGSGRRGDLAATVAAVLLDAEARAETPAARAGRLREPVLFVTGVLRALDGVSDGEALGFGIGADMRQLVFRSPTVFNFYAPDQPLPGSALVGPAFGIHSSGTALVRLNLLSWLLDFGGSPPDPQVAGATGTSVDVSRYLADATDAPALLDRLATLAAGRPLPEPARGRAVAAIEHWTANNAPTDWRERRVRTAAYLVFASPHYQVSR